MFLTRLQLKNFKNYSELELDFKTRFTALCGKNGMGKTNLLDAIHYLALTKSNFQSTDKQNIKQGEDYFNIWGAFEKDQGTEEIFCACMPGKKKNFQRNRSSYDKLSEHIGFIPLVMITPYDISLIQAGSEERRKFIDNTLSQTSKEYLNILMRYQKVIQQRNAYLKKLAVENRKAGKMLDTYDEQLLPLANEIFKQRSIFLESFIDEFEETYQELSLERENVSIEYLSPLQEKSMGDWLKTSREKDRILERTTKGIHKDELDFQINFNSLKKIGSQGQQKTYLLALKLAQLKYLKNKNENLPILILDDVYDRLDSDRASALMNYLSQSAVSQIVLSDTSAERIKNLFKAGKQELSLIEIENGEIAERKHYDFT